MASNLEDVQFTALLTDVENFYVDKFTHDQSHKARALLAFSQDEIDRYCQLTFSAASFQTYKPFYQKEIEKAQTTFDKMKPHFEKAKQNLEALEKSKDEKLKAEAEKLTAANLEEMELTISVGKLIVDKYHFPMMSCSEEIKKNLAKLAEGEAFIAERGNLLGTLKTKWASSNK